MKITKVNLLVLVVIFGFSFPVFAQRNQMENANKKYESLSYIDAISIYEKVAKKGYKSVELFERLGNSYYFNSEFEKACHWYEELFGMQKEITPEYYYRYSQSLKSKGDYKKSDEMMLAFIQKAGTDLRASIYSKNSNYLDKITANSGRFEISDAGVNSELSDYGGAFLGDSFVFTTGRDTATLFSIKMKWNNQAFTNLYISERITDSTFSQPKKLNRNINSRFNESSAIFTKDGKTMYFTRNNFNEGKKRSSSERITLLKIYRSRFTDRGWGQPEQLPFNSDQYSVAHAALSPDEKILYFVSDMPGSYGQSDLYKVTINTNGTFGKPQNLGKPINTEGKETFPFVSADNTLYYSSDGHPGLGGLDVFSLKINTDGSYNTVDNVGTPVNSGTDDFAFIIDSESRNGFFSSNRQGGKGLDDIYRFKETRKISCEQSVSGTVRDKETGSFISGAYVILSDQNFKVLDSLTVDVQGYYSFSVPCGSGYYIRVGKDTYETDEISVKIPDFEGKTSMVDITLGKRNKIFKIGDDIGPKLGIQSIYFDLDKAIIRSDALPELEKILDLMESHPSLRIDVRSHTDSRQTADYNLKLSDARAKATMQWLVEHGVSRERLSGRGYGESELLNKCADGVECTEQEHQLNRRSQFIVTAM